MPLWPCLLCLGGSACGDSVVVARELSLVSASVESRDAGSDAGEGSLGPHFNFGHGGTGPFGPRPPAHFGTGGSPSAAPHASKDDDDGDDSDGTGGSGGKSSSPKHP